MIRTNTGQYVYSDSDIFTSSDEFDTIDEAIEAALEDDSIIEGFEVGEVIELEFDESDFTFDPEEELYIALCDECGESADSFELSKEESEELKKAMAKAGIDYLNKNNIKPTCYAVNVKRSCNIEGEYYEKN